MFETIVALATPPLKSALAVIRVSGETSFEVVSKCFSKDITNLEKRTALIGEIKDGDEVIDQVVLIAYKGPKSFTGENLVEIICHGSMLIANQIIEVLLSCGARLAKRGEYSMRSHLNGKLDLIQAEAINDVINATTKEAKKLSMFSLGGDTSKLLQPLKKIVTDLICLIEVNIDYPEYEDIEVANKETIVQETEKSVQIIDNLIKNGEKGLIIKEGIKVGIFGKPNVGKSSLLNALLGEDKAIVTEIAGTTRDIVEGEVNLGGITLKLLDTAGIRESNDTVENIGVNKAKQTMEEVELCLVVLDSSKELDDEDLAIINSVKDKPHLLVYNKADKINASEDKIYVSAINKDVTKLKDAIFDLFQLDQNSFEQPSLCNTRQVGLLKQAKQSLLDAKTDAENDNTMDLIIVSLHDAYKAILNILGEASETDISKEIFARFCVGK